MKWLLLIPSLSCAQPLPITFKWDAPTNMSNVVGYQFYWPSGFAQLPINITDFSVPNLPYSFNLETGVFSLGSNGTVSDTNKLFVANIVANIELSTNGVDWETKWSQQVTFERPESAMIRVRLTTTNNNATQ